MKLAKTRLRPAPRDLDLNIHVDTAETGIPSPSQFVRWVSAALLGAPRHVQIGLQVLDNEAAQALYSAVETHLQLTGGMLGVKPIGHDRYDRPRTLMQWADITRLLLHHMGVLFVPVAVGLVAWLEPLRQSFGLIMLCIVLGIVLILGTVGRLYQRMNK